MSFRKKVMMGILIAIIFMAIISTNVFAITNSTDVVEVSQPDFEEAKGTSIDNQPTACGIYYQDGVFSLDPGTYKLAGDVELDDGDRIELSGGDFELDLNGCGLIGCLEGNPVLTFYDGTLLINNEGVIFNSSQESEDILKFGANTNITLEQSIYQGNVTIEDGANCTINGGEFCGYMYVNDSELTVEDFTLEETLVINHSKVTINSGKIICEDNDAIYVENASNLTINDGEFRSDVYNALLAEAGFWEYEINNEGITICGGTFNGVLSALALYETDSVILTGGTYSISGDSEDAMGAIVTEANGEEEFLSFLGEGYEYSEPLTLSSIPGYNYEGQLATQNSISVVPKAENQEYVVEDGKGNEIIFTAPEGDTYTFYINDILTITDKDLQEIVDLLNDPAITFNGLKEQHNKLINYGKNAAEGKGELLKLYEVYLNTNGVEIHEVEGGFKIRIKITDQMKDYEKFQLIFIEEDGTTEDSIELTINDDYLEGTIPHLSIYALVGIKTEVVNDNTDQDVDTNTESTNATEETTTPETKPTEEAITPETKPTDELINTETKPAEEIITSKTNQEEKTINNPETGDNIILWISLMVFSILGIVFIVIYTKKRK